MLPKSTASILGTFVVYSGIPQMQRSSGCLWGFNPLLLRLHGEISLSLLCLPNSWCSALVLVLLLCVGRPQTSVPCPDRKGLKQQLISALWITQAWGRAGYCSDNCNAGQACGGSGWNDIATAWGMPCVLPGTLSMDLRILAVVSCTCSQRGLGSDLCLHTGFFVTAAAAALAFHARLWDLSW